MDINVLFGASSFGKKALQFLKSNNIKTDYFCDNDRSKWGSSIEGIKILAPFELEVLKINMNVKVIITSTYEKEIRQQLEEMGFEHICNYYDFLNSDINIVDKHHNERDQFDRGLILNSEDKINSVIGMLEDDISKVVFKSLLDFRLTKDLFILKGCCDNCAEYFNQDIIKFCNDEVIIDGGSFIGDTLESFMKAVEFKKYYAFEPDRRNYIQLESNIVKLGIRSKVISVNKGMSNVNGIVAFLENEELRGSSAIDKSGNTEIEVVRLDDFIPSDEKITFIKMDIEGAEIDALNGCKNILQKYKPKLAICIYHKPDDLWEIPLLIKRLVPEYQIYIRHYSNYLWETVCYAI